MVPLLRAERAAFCELLAPLPVESWDRPTECPAWSVKGIALHVLGDDLSLLSRQRDDATQGLVREAGRPSAPGDFRGLLDSFNERWVDVAQFFGTPLVIELLEWTGERTADWYSHVAPEELGEPVMLFGGGPAPYWQIAAREHLERWVHHEQIRRALDLPPLGPDLVIPALAVVFRALPALPGLDAEPGATVVIAVDRPAVAWTLVRGDDGWVAHDGEPTDPTVRLALPLAGAALLFSRGVPRADVAAHAVVEGDAELGESFVRGLALAVGR